MKNLVKRKTVTSPICNFCLQASESCLHALWECEQLKPVWQVDFRDLNVEKGLI